MKKIRKHKFNGVPYSIKWEPPGDPQDLGECTSPYEDDPTILITPEKKGKQLFALLLHEFLHASHWRLTEKKVLQIERDISNALWRIGVRFTKTKVAKKRK